MTDDSVMTVPTERSMPPVMMTNVSPRARTPTTAVAMRMLTKLSKLRKCGVGDAEEDDQQDEGAEGQEALEEIASDTALRIERRRVWGPLAVVIIGLLTRPFRAAWRAS